MASDPISSSASAPDATEVMASIDSSGWAPQLVIADITADDAWLSIPAATAVSLAEWR